MKQLNFVIENATGLHARPAKVFVTTAKQYKADIRILYGSKKVNAKSLIAVLGLGVAHGGEILVEVNGADEELAAEALQTAVAAGLGEGEHMPAAPKTELVNGVPPSTNGHPVGQTIPNGLRGVGAAPGLAIGPVFQLRQTAVTITETFAGVEAEQARLGVALADGEAQLVALRDQMQAQTPEEAAIFDVHRELLTDEDLLEAVQQKIQAQQSAAKAWQATIQERASMMASLDDPLLAARAADIRDVGNRILKLLAGEDTAGIQWPDHPVVVTAHDLTPSDTAMLDPQKVLGFATAVGGPTAHSAIIARALGLPAVVSAGVGLLEIGDGTAVILDGTTGIIQVNPDEAAQTAAKSSQAAAKQQELEAKSQAGAPAITQDNHRIEIAANIGGVKDAQNAHESGAEAVGLLRTEFLFLGRATPPSEEEQFEVYRQIAEAMAGKPVVVRTLDIGGDKPLPYVQVPPEDNPFLGERGLRLCLNRPELLREQLRAILRAASFGSLRIMFPMVADLSEWHAAKTMVDEIRAELNAPAVEVGIMIEIPSAALMADKFAQEVDFFSVGTNDLTQYTLAMDRMHPTLAGKSDGLHPAVLRLIDTTVRAAHAAGKWVGVCGALGADPQAVPILLGLGVDELSVSVPSIALVKAQVRTLTFAAAQQLAAQALDCGTAGEVRSLMGN